jgi:hypothetical protein
MWSDTTIPALTRGSLTVYPRSPDSQTLIIRLPYAICVWNRASPVKEISAVGLDHDRALKVGTVEVVRQKRDTLVDDIGWCGSKPGELSVTYCINHPNRHIHHFRHYLGYRDQLGPKKTCSKGHKAGASFYLMICLWVVDNIIYPRHLRSRVVANPSE